MYGIQCPLMVSVVDKTLGSQLKVKLMWLIEGTKCLMLLVEVPIVLYQAIADQKFSQ